MKSLFPLVVACVALLLHCGKSHAQVVLDRAEGRVASATLPSEHWSLHAVRRVKASGLALDYPPAERIRSRDDVAQLLADAATRAAENGSAMAGLIRSWHDRFSEEFPRAGAAGPALSVRDGGAALAYLDRSGAAAPGFGDHVREGAIPLDDRSALVGEVVLAALVGSRLSLLAEPRIAGDVLAVPRWEAAVRWGGWELSVGRLPLGYGFGVGGGVVLGDGPVLDRLEIETASPVRLPGWLRHLGPVSFQTFLSRLSEERHAGDPFLWGASGAIQPHPRLTLSIHRGAMFGGEWSTEPITPRGLAYMLIGKHGGIENQIVSAEARFRMPTERVMPLMLHCEWGAEDSAGAFYAVPGAVCGAFVPALPYLPEVAAGVEYSTFGASCCGNPKWYRHSVFPGSWAVENTPLGHPLGGAGSEVLLYTLADAFDARLHVEGRAFWRDRGEENLYSPGREGESFGGALRLSLQASRRSEIHLSALREVGALWSEEQLEAGVRLFF